MRLGCVGAVLGYALEECPADDPFHVQLRETARLGLGGLCTQVERWQDGAYVGRMADLAREHGITLEPTWDDAFASYESSALRTADAFSSWLDALCVPFDVAIVGIVVRGGNRFASSPTVDEQIDLISQRLPSLADRAAERGIRLALENHADYRAPEILAIIERAGRSNIGVRLDTGNPFTIGEEPVEAARLLAPYTITTHFKDMHVYPVGRVQGPHVPHQTGAPLGKGAVRLPEIIDLLATYAPHPDDLPLNIEIDWRPADEDGRRWAADSITYCRQAFARHLRPASTSPLLGAHHE